MSAIVRSRLEGRGLLVEALDIAKQHGATFNDVAGKRRTARVVKARHAIWMQLKSYGYSYPEVGWPGGGVHHTTVMAAHR